jgi:hypothetical protein
MGNLSGPEMQLRPAKAICPASRTLSFDLFDLSSIQARKEDRKSVV